MSRFDRAKVTVRIRKSAIRKSLDSGSKGAKNILQTLSNVISPVLAEMSEIIFSEEMKFGAEIVREKKKDFELNEAFVSAALVVTFEDSAFSSRKSSTFELDGFSGSSVAFIGLIGDAFSELVNHGR